ncbi:MAG TPA: N-acetyl-gamma-glutamyl-phosphate reductase [Chitinispirillaceae bacterium]|nr:N-acetyl-gamma-glutamyl-phosphate reductase [Chitinispirillaceae bacterium]
MFKIFVDGQEGTTGLQINERLSKHSGIEILKIENERKKDIEYKRKFLNEADIVFLCLPDDASRESVSLISNERTCIIDASTAHRTDPLWAYGFPELKGQREKIKKSKRIAVPGCYATGFVALMYPLVRQGFVQSDYPVTLHAVSGYSGGGKKLISQYESAKTEYGALVAPRPYSAKLNHKHLPEMQKIVGLDFTPIFTPLVCNYYKGMAVMVPLHRRLLPKKSSAKEIHEFLSAYYASEQFVRVLPFETELSTENGYLNVVGSNDTNRNDICVFYNDEQIVLISRLDNLGKGASGAAVQCMNIVCGVDEGTGLSL